jgi:hypothetical protein
MHIRKCASFQLTSDLWSKLKYPETMHFLEKFIPFQEINYTKPPKNLSLI